MVSAVDASASIPQKPVPSPLAALTVIYLFTEHHSIIKKVGSRTTISHRFCYIIHFSPHRKDVRLPVQLQRAMAAEAEAAREARAKVIAAEGEQKASRALREASEVIGDSPAALQLRYLQVSRSPTNIIWKLMTLNNFIFCKLRLSNA